MEARSPVRRLSAIQVRDDDGLDQGLNSGNCEKWLGSRYILKEEPMDLLTLDEMCEKNRGVRHDFKLLDLSNWKGSITLTEMDKTVGRTCKLRGVCWGL